MRRAIVFWACHKDYYFDAARRSAISAKQQMPDVDAVLLTDRPGYGRRPFNRIVVVPRPASIDVLLPPLLHLPEEYSSGIYVGAKCIFVAPVYDAFELVEDARTDIALTFTSGKRHDTMFPSPGIPKAFPHFRSGFVAFQHHPRMRNFFGLWKDEFKKERTTYARLRRKERQERHTDQSPLRKALYNSDLSIAVFPVNFSATLGDEVVRGTVRTFSFRGGRGLDKLAAEANRLAPHARLFVRGKSTLL